MDPHNVARYTLRITTGFLSCTLRAGCIREYPNGNLASYGLTLSRKGSYGAFLSTEKCARPRPRALSKSEVLGLIISEGERAVGGDL